MMTFNDSDYPAVTAFYSAECGIVTDSQKTDGTHFQQMPSVFTYV